MMSRPREKAVEQEVEQEVVRPRRVIRPPSYLQDYEVSYPQRHLTFADEYTQAVRDDDVLSYIREMREESRQLRQHVQRISDIIATSPALAPPHVSSLSFHESEGVSAKPMAASMLASYQDDRNPSQSDNTPLVPPRDESLHKGRDNRQDLIEDLTSSLKKMGKMNSSQSQSGQSTPRYTEPPNSDVSAQYVPRHDANVHDSRQPQTNPHRWQCDDSVLPSNQTSYPAWDFHHHKDVYSELPCTEYRSAKDIHDPFFDNHGRTIQRPALHDQLNSNLLHSRGPEHYRTNERLYLSDPTYRHLGAQGPHRTWHSSPMQYRGPTPTIPDFVHDDPREFTRLKIALDNLLPDDATESFKFQILIDHLKLEDALLVADSYSHSRYPFSDTMRALTDMYGQPHQLALQRISNLMDGPNIKSGDVKAFKGFALKVRALVGMLNQLGSPGWTELKCGSHVSRLLAKLPYDLRANFKRFINPLQTPIPSLMDLADWLEYEVRVQVDGTQYCTYPVYEKQGFRKDKRTGDFPRKLTTVLHGGEQTKVSFDNVKSTSVSSDRKPEKPKKYCPFCDSIQHYMNQCSNFKLLTKEQIENWIKTGQRCWRCGRGHHSSKCTLKAKCKKCDRRHLEVLHDVNASSTSNGKSSSRASEGDNIPIASTSQTLYLDRPTSSRQVLLKLSRVIIWNGDKSLETYAILDDGSERTMLLHEAAHCLDLQGKPEDLALRTVRHEVHTIHGNSVSFSIASASLPDQAFQIHGAFTAKELGLVQHTYPVNYLKERYRHLRNLPLPEINEAQPLILIGSDYPHLITPVEPVRLGPPGGPAAVHTRLGWTLQGPSKFLQPLLQPQQCLFVSCLSSEAELFSQVEKLWKLDILPYQSEKVVTRSRQDTDAIRILQEKTIRVDVGGVKRYATPLLWKETLPPLHAPKEAVLTLLRSTEKRLMREPQKAASYNAEINKLLQAGYVTPISTKQCDLSPHSWYIPHHMIHHNDKDRIVFNCSFEFQGQSLNEHLLPGPTLGASLLGVLLRFREHPIAFCSDVRGMFHQVRLLDEDKPFLRFLWRNGKAMEPPTVYQWEVLPFGTTCSPCCATFALQSHVKNHLEPTDQVRQTVECGFYVDNCLQSVPTARQAVELVNRLQSHLLEGGFELRQWASNVPTVIQHLPDVLKSESNEIWLRQESTNPQERALGLIWQCKSDTLEYKPYHSEEGDITMRKIYRTLAKQYDPLGFLIPFTTRAKIIVQMLWSNKRDWDDPCLPSDLLDSWHQWESELPQLSQISQPRCYSPCLQSTVRRRSLHVFCDASERAYGSVAYLSTEDVQSNIQVAFLAARSRVAPKKQLSIPRLELCAALTGAQLGTVLTKELTLEIHNCVYWTDSTTVLAWLQSDSCRYKVFVGTRITEIQELSDPKSWHYVNSSLNPADDITRGLSLIQLSEDTRWNKGPSFLLQSSSYWPKAPEGHNAEDFKELRKSTFCGLLNKTAAPVKPDVLKFNDYQELLKATVQSLDKVTNGKYPPDADDFCEAELTVLRNCQMQDFHEEYALLKEGKNVSGHSRLMKLAPEYDHNSALIRVGGRLRRCENLNNDVLHPVVLTPGHPVTKLLIKHYDTQLHHPGAGRVHAELRRKFWILRGREAIKKHQHRCIDCNKWRGKPAVPRMADLPPSSLRLFKPPFYSTGIDCFGPLVIKIGRRTEKRWGIIYKCLTTRAVYLDLLDHMDTDSFLMSLRRFIARRGKPYELLSDQGTNFKGGHNELNDAFCQIHPTLREQLAKEQIRFRFNPPSAPHFGGSWEREVRSVKTSLRTTLGAQIVTEEVLRTILIEVESILNSRPLGYVSSDVGDPDPVTPNSLLMGRPDSSLPQVVYPESDLLSRKRWRHSQILSDHFWKHFIQDFLPTLQARQKWNKEEENMTVGTVVLIADDQLPRALWRVGTVTSVFPGSDGRVRTASIKVKDHTYTRPVSRLIRLPALPPDTDDTQ